MNNVSVILPNWNGARFLPTCLTALRSQTYRDFEIIVVDNGSTDASREILAHDFPEARVITLEQNRGFAPAVNLGIRAAKGAIIALLNNDTEADAHWLAELVRALDQNPRAGIAASKLLLFDRREILHSAGDFYRVDGIPGNRGVWERDEGQYDAPTPSPSPVHTGEGGGGGGVPVFGACGGAAAFRKTMLDAIGLFDEALGSYCEDVDLNWRARLAGYDAVYAPTARVYHHLSATGGGPLASFYVGRNFIYVLAKDYPASLWKKHWGKILRAQLRIAGDALQHWRGAAARARLRGQLAGLSALPRALKARARVQKTRVVGDEELERVLWKEVCR